jgi:hypothetical protein
MLKLMDCFDYQNNEHVRLFSFFGLILEKGDLKF